MKNYPSHPTIRSFLSYTKANSSISDFQVTISPPSSHTSSPSTSPKYLIPHKNPASEHFVKPSKVPTNVLELPASETPSSEVAQQPKHTSALTEPTSKPSNDEPLKDLNKTSSNHPSEIANKHTKPKSTIYHTSKSWHTYTCFVGCVFSNKTVFPTKQSCAYCHEVKSSPVHFCNDYWNNADSSGDQCCDCNSHLC